MFNVNHDVITNWTVTAVQYFYRLLIHNTYFILSNGLFLVLLFFFRLSMNNFILFIIPIFFLLVSFSAQFKAVADNEEETVSLKRYFSLYKEILKNNWNIYLFYTFFICLLVLDLRILLVADLTVLLYPLLITGSFLISSMFFVLLISTDERAKEVPFKKKISWSLLVSYRLPKVTMLNVFYVIVTIFLLQNFSLAYLCFFGGAINYYVWMNLTRQFSVDLFYEHIR
ncbi:hypothetical protein [Jeotgalibaca porci]|uniref:hypothetical protein n=1 Tax=Jeotgalibaca porci TaxID=1868793 RepID=UPI001D04EAF8|nr:hypothetical protein [Jeotgalibaca porci]